MQLAQFLRQLTRMAEEFGVAVVLTNQVVANPDGILCEDATKPIGGILLLMHPILVPSGKQGENRICSIFDSPTLPESEAMYSIGASGIEDAKE